MSQAWDPTRPSKTRDRLKVEWWIDLNEIDRFARRETIKALLLSRTLSEWQVEQIIALSTGLEALYDLGEPQDFVICQWMRKHPTKSIDELLTRATWVFVAK